MYFNIEKLNLGNPGWFPVDLQKYSTSLDNQCCPKSWSSLFPSQIDKFTASTCPT